MRWYFRLVSPRSLSSNHSGGEDEAEQSWYCTTVVGLSCGRFGTVRDKISLLGSITETFGGKVGRVAAEVFERGRRLEAKKRNWDTDGGSLVREECE